MSRSLARGGDFAGTCRRDIAKSLLLLTLHGSSPGAGRTFSSLIKRLLLVFLTCIMPVRDGTKRENYARGIKYIVGDSLPPDGQYREFASRRVAEIISPTLLYYGRIHYLDMPGGRRHSLFVYRLRSNGGHDRFADVRAEYLEIT